MLIALGKRFYELIDVYTRWTYRSPRTYSSHQSLDLSGPSSAPDKNIPGYDHPVTWCDTKELSGSSTTKRLLPDSMIHSFDTNTTSNERLTLPVDSTRTFPRRHQSTPSIFLLLWQSAELHTQSIMLLLAGSLLLSRMLSRQDPTCLQRLSTNTHPTSPWTKLYCGTQISIGPPRMKANPSQIPPRTTLTSSAIKQLPGSKWSSEHGYNTTRNPTEEPTGPPSATGIVGIAVVTQPSDQ